MKSNARVVIIGGGVAGASTLYHLAQRGWTDCVLVEMDEITSGSTWHAAGNVPTFSGNRNIIQMQKYSTELYARLSTDENYPVAYHQTGSIRLAQSKERFDEFKHVVAMANSLGLEYELLDLAGLNAHLPQLETHDLVGGLWDPADGDIDPSQLTQALASAARKLGASVHRFTRVTGVERVGGKEWKVITDKGEIIAEFVVNAGGYRGADVSALGGQFLPLVTLEHQYMVTEPVPELEALDHKIPLVRDPDDSYYLRQEKHGLILGPYEWKATTHWTDGKLPDNFANELYPDDLDRLEWYIGKACERLPMLGTVGVQRVINGPIPYSPDGLPYVGPAYGLPNFFHICGFSFGICQGGGAGKTLAEWIIDGQPEWDLWSLDPRRYGAYADQQYVVDRAIEVYQNEYAMHVPNAEWPAGRPRHVSPLYDTLAAKGAEFGARGGWERATWFADGVAATNESTAAGSANGSDLANGSESANGDPYSPPGTEEYLASYSRARWFEPVGAECRHVRDYAGLLDIGGFTRFELAGAGAAAWLDSLIAGRMPSVGRVSLSYLCHPGGGVWSEVTITRLDEERFLLVSAAAARRHDHQWLEEHLPADAGFTLTDVTEASGSLVLAGPASRAILSSLTDTDLSNAGFKWLTGREMTVAGIDVVALRVNYVGELGWELHVPVGDELALYQALMDAGREHKLRDIGMYAMESMRLEKSYRAWKSDLDHTLSPLASGLSRFVDVQKSVDFIGKSALREEVENGSPEVFATLEMDADDTDAFFGCPIVHGDTVVGMVTSGGYGHRVEKSLALGYVKASLDAGSAFHIDVCGERRKAKVIDESPYDAENSRLRC